MSGRQKLIILISAAVSLTAAFAVGYATGKPNKPHPMSLRGEAAQDWRDQDALEVSPAVRDAVARWKIKGGDDMDGRNIQIMEFPDRMCVKLAFDDLSIGGEPVYCYKTVQGDDFVHHHTTELIYDGSDVE
jgi:hypothetical protein